MIGSSGKKKKRLQQDTYSIRQYKLHDNIWEKAKESNWIGNLDVRHGGLFREDVEETEIQKHFLLIVTVTKSNSFLNTLQKELLDRHLSPQSYLYPQVGTLSNNNNEILKSRNSKIEGNSHILINPEK